MGWIPPKTDWNSQDYYNFYDLNRVESNTQIIVDLLRLFDTNVNLDINKNRDMKTIEFADSINRIEGNIELLRQRYTPLGWEESKLDWLWDDPFSYKDANRLERNLFALYRHYKGNLDNRRHCGAYTCGEEVI